MRGNEYMEQKHPIAWHVPNLINICIDSVEDGEMTGKIYHCYSEEAGTGKDITDAGTERNIFIKCKISSEFILAGISPMGGRRRSLAVCQCTGIYQNIK